MILFKTLIVGTPKNRLAEAVLTSTYNPCFGAKIRKISTFLAKKNQFLKLKNSLFIAWASFRNVVSDSLSPVFFFFFFFFFVVVVVVVVLLDIFRSPNVKYV